MSFILFLLSSVVYADAQIDKAERIRLSEEIKSLEKRGRWMAIDIKYRKILALKNASPSFRDHSIAAQAASNLGNMLATYKRVKRAYAIEEKEELKMWLGAIEQTTAPVEIIVSRSFKEDFTLNVKEDFYAPEDQNAFSYAPKLITKNKKYNGKGRYTDKDGNIHQGTYKNGRAHGLGVFLDAEEGSFYEGMWENEK